MSLRKFQNFTIIYFVYYDYYFDYDYAGSADPNQIIVTNNIIIVVAVVDIVITVRRQSNWLFIWKRWLSEVLSLIGERYRVLFFLYFIYTFFLLYSLLSFKLK